ncbi:hypothetical protein A2223_00905 [Candidatus Falkowbacteria bacterium RIFOXYA2_FULL_35_8]|nr:MAG: hypothetical protein A2300_02720 [Candidatus Falkowbacteria bacterium RIFOXYB2_FULL_35_7]OGF34729.1 MAG: hypothetical protein A2223_00905 [Candidatus Falkowbacteria bacterium RIFOXYA2_FULL_35_8]
MKMKHEQVQSEYWDKEADRITRINDEMSLVARNEISQFLDFAKIEAGMKILEIGCGAGRFTVPLLKRDVYVTGTDISQKSLEALDLYCNKLNLAHRLHLINTDFDKPLFKNEFDVIIIGNVIHHFNPEIKFEILRNITKALKPGGQIVIFEPNGRHPLYLPYYLYLEWSGRQKGIWQAEKGVMKSKFNELKKILQNCDIQFINVHYHTIIPLRLEERFKFIPAVNKTLEKVPVLKNFSAFLWIKGEKSFNKLI